jgi:hypothetical protein
MQTIGLHPEEEDKMSKFEVFVDDNYNDKKARYPTGSFASYSEVLAEAKAIIDRFLETHCRPGTTSQKLYEGYAGFGEAPYIVPAVEPYFSARDYAQARCRELCREGDARHLARKVHGRQRRTMRGISREENLKAAEELIEKAKQAEPDITDGLLRTANDLKGEMVGLEFRIKVDKERIADC